MKKVILNVPEDMAQELGNKLSELIKEFDIQEDNDGVLDCLLPITERVKTFEDACKVLNGRAEAGDEDAALLLADYESNADNIKTSGIVAFMKLCIIAAALNEGWKPQFTNDEYRWYPWFTLWTEEELKGKSEQWKKDHALWLCGGNSYAGATCGLASAYSDHAWSSSSSYISARLAVKSKELAVYFGKQFISIWADYVGKF